MGNAEGVLENLGETVMSANKFGKREKKFSRELFTYQDYVTLKRIILI